MSITGIEIETKPNPSAGPTTTDAFAWKIMKWVRKALQCHRLIAAALWAWTALLAPARADDSLQQIVPEFNDYTKLSDRSRLYLLADVTKTKSENSTDGELGAHLDLTLIPLLRPALREADWERERYLWTRFGYVVLGPAGSGAAGITERRGIAELTGRLLLPQQVWLVNRVRVDLRDIDGEFSQRYRLRMGVEREFTVDGVVMVPYAQAETLYDTRYLTWNRQLYQAGVEVELSKAWRVESYLARQNDSHSASGNVDIFGLVFKHYH